MQTQYNYLCYTLLSGFGLTLAITYVLITSNNIYYGSLLMICSSVGLFLFTYLNRKEYETIIVFVSLMYYLFALVETIVLFGYKSHMNTIVAVESFLFLLSAIIIFPIFYIITIYNNPFITLLKILFFLLSISILFVLSSIFLIPDTNFNLGLISMPMFVGILFLQISFSIFLIFNSLSLLRQKFIRFLYLVVNITFLFFTLIIILILSTNSLDMDYEYSLPVSILILVLSVVLSIYNHNKFPIMNKS